VSFEPRPFVLIGCIVGHSSKYCLKERAFTVLVSSFESYRQNYYEKTASGKSGCTSEVVTATKYASNDEVVRLAKRRMGVRLLKSFAKAPVKSETGASGFRESETCTE